MFGKRSVSNRLFTHGDAEARIKNAVWEFADEANEGQHGMRLVNKGAAVEVASRSLATTKDQAFSVRQQHALKAVSEHISLVQTSKLINPASAHLDLLAVGHPLSTRSNRMSSADLLSARARWYADDPRVVGTEVRSLVIQAFTASAGTPEHEYAAARLKAMGVAHIPMVAAAGFNDGANRGFWRRQLRNAKGQFAFMGGKGRLLVGRDGKAYNQTGNIVSTDPDRNTVILETPNGRLFEADADALEIGEVKALIPGKDDADGLSGTPAKTSASDTIVDESAMVFVDQPYGFGRVDPKDITMPQGINKANVTSAWEDEAGNYQVLKSDTGFILSRVELSGIVPISAHENWVSIQKAIDDDEPLFERGEDAVAMIPEGELSESEEAPVVAEEGMDQGTLTPRELAAGYSWSTSPDGSYIYESSNNGIFEISELPNGNWGLLLDGPDGSNSNLVGEFDTAAGAFEQGQIEADSPEFDEGMVQDYRDDNEFPELSEESEAPVIPESFYETDRGEFFPEGSRNDVESADYTDDPAELAQRYDERELTEALAEAVQEGTGDGMLPFDGGDEFVSAEALYTALREQGADADRILDGIEGKTPEEAPVAQIPDESAEEEQEVSAELTPADLRESGELPPLLEALTDDELQEIIDTEDYRKFLPENEEFANIPEGMYELDGGNTPPGDVVSETPADGAPNDPIGLASEIDTETLEQLLRDAVNGVGGRPGYAQATYLDSDGEEFSYDVPAEFLREALQLQGIDTNEILREAYENNEPTPEETAEMLEAEGVEEVEDNVFGGLTQAEKDDLIAGTKEGGFTVDFTTGEIPEDGYMVAAAADIPEEDGTLSKREEVVTLAEFEADPDKYLDAFVARNVDKLTQDGYYIGTWTSTGKNGVEYVFLDVSERFVDKEEALQAARDREEIAVFGVAEFEEFFTDPEKEAQKNAGEQGPEEPEEPDVSSEQLPGDDAGGESGVDQGAGPGDSGEVPPTEGPKTEVTYDTKGWKKVGGQSGSNPGGLYENENGDQFYVKFPKSDDHARNEVLASALYEAMGIPVGRVYLGTADDGSTVLVSPILPDIEGELNDFLDNPEVLASALKGFVPDAWLNNWDAVGLAYDNMLVKDGEVYRIDPGGSLFYRAQGKNKDMPEDVLLVDSLRNPEMNQQAADIFGGMTDDAIADSAQVVADLPPEKITEIIDIIFADDPVRGVEIMEILLKRREWLMGEFGSVAPETETQSEAEGNTESDAAIDQLATSRGWSKYGENEYLLDIEGEGSPTLVVSKTPSGQWALSRIATDEVDELLEVTTELGLYTTAEQAFDIAEIDGIPSPPPVAEEAKPALEPETTSAPTVLDLSGDIDAQVNDAIQNKKELTFAYDGSNRTVTPVQIEVNQKTGNTNILTVDTDGKFKKFTVSKMAELAPDPEATDTPGEVVSVDDAEVPTAAQDAQEKQFTDMLAALDALDAPTTTDIENYGEGEGVDDDFTANAISKAEAPTPESAPTPSTAAEKLLSDAIQSALDGDEDEDTPKSVDELNKASAAIDTDQSAPDIIWQSTIDAYSGKLLANGHIVVSSVMHGLRRYDVVVRRQNDNSFHVYHRVKLESGETRVRELGTNGWQSTKALFKKIDKQIIESKNESSVKNNLTKENDRTLYADTSAPKQVGSFVDKNNDVLAIGDRVIVTNPTHSKANMGAKILDLVREKNASPDAEGFYTYTDYLRVRYDDNTFNTIVGQSTTLETSMSIGTPTAAPGAPNGGPGPAIGNSYTSSQAFNILPTGSILKMKDGTLVKKSPLATYTVHGKGPQGKMVLFAPGDSATLVSLDPDFTGVAKTSPTPGNTAPPGNTGPLGSKSLDNGVPESGTQGDYPDVRKHSPEEMKSLLNSSIATMGFGSKFVSSFQGAANMSVVAKWLKAGLKADGSPDAELPQDKNGVRLVPGAVVWVGGGRGIVTSISEYRTSTNTPNPTQTGASGGKVNIVMLTGAATNKKFNDVEVRHVSASTEFVPRLLAQKNFNVNIDPLFEGLLFRGKKSLYTTPVNSSVDNISGPGVDDPEMVNLPDWGEAPEGTRSIGSILNRLTDETSRAARDGLFALVDGSSVEDLQVRFQRVLGEDGTPRVRMTGKLTDWAGRAMMEKISTGEIMFTPAEGIQIDEYKISKQENLENKGKSSLTYVDSYSNGATYTAEVNGATVTFFRAIPVNAEGDNTNENSEVDFFKATQSSDIPRAWHNMFDITLPIDTTKEALEEALTNVGVASARPATEVDIKTVAENKLLTLFANLTDGKKNLTGVLRQQELQKIEKDWGVTAADVKVVPDGTQGRLTYRLPEAVAQKIVDRTGLKPLHHNIGLSSVLPAGETSNSVYDKSMSNLVRILSSGRLESTVARHISGDFGEGSSSERDVMGPGANYTFLYMNQQYGHSKTGSSTIQMVFDPVKIVSKLGFYANRGDGYGTLPAPDTSTFDEIRERKDNGEFLVKDSLSFEDSIGVNINSKMVPELIDRLKAAGIDTLGGMSLEDYFAVDVSKFVNYDKTPKTV